MKILISIVLIFLALTLFSASFFYLTRYDKSIKKGNAVKLDKLKIHDDGTFRILQITDTHLMTNGTDLKDYKTLKWVEKALEISKPDLVEVTGDVSGWHVKNRDNGLLAFANLLERKKVYWAMTFGNHDGEHSLDENGKDIQIGKCGKQNDVLKYCENVDTFDTSKGTLVFGDNTKGNAEIYKLLQGYEYCLTKRDSLEYDYPDEMGVGNFVIELVNKNGETVFAIIHMDTHGKMYINPKNNDKGFDGYIDKGYVGLTKKQIAWYENVVRGYSDRNIKSAIFMHISTYGYRQIVEEYKNLDEYGIPVFAEKNNIIACVNKFKQTKFTKNEAISGPFWDDGLESVMNKYKSTNLIAVGHEHDNCFYAVKNIAEKSEHINNVIYAFGRVSGVNAWGRKIPIGATIYDINTLEENINAIYNIKEIYPN